MKLFSKKLNSDKDQEQSWSLPLEDVLSKDQELMVLEDLDNGNEYFLYKLDSFKLRGRAYICMASYEPETGAHTEPELVIMRLLRSRDNKEQYFESIRNSEELDRVFNAFYKRLEDSLRR